MILRGLATCWHLRYGKDALKRMQAVLWRLARGRMTPERSVSIASDVAFARKASDKSCRELCEFVDCAPINMPGIVVLEALSVCFADALRVAGRPAAAIPFYEALLRRLETAPNERSRAVCQFGRATGLADAGFYPKALDAYDELLAHHAGALSPPSVLKCSLNRAAILEGMCRHHSALMELGRACSLLESDGADPSGELRGTWCYHIGCLLFSAKRYGEAIEPLTEAAGTFRKLGILRDLGDSLSTLSRAFLCSERIDEAEQARDEAEASYKGIGAIWALRASRLNWAIALGYRGDFSGCIRTIISLRRKGADPEFAFQYHAALSWAYHMAGVGAFQMAISEGLLAMDAFDRISEWCGYGEDHLDFIYFHRSLLNHMAGDALTVNDPVLAFWVLSRSRALFPRRWIWPLESHVEVDGRSAPERQLLCESIRARDRGGIREHYRRYRQFHDARVRESRLRERGRFEEYDIQGVARGDLNFVKHMTQEYQVAVVDLWLTPDYEVKGFAVTPDGAEELRFPQVSAAGDIRQALTAFALLHQRPDAGLNSFPLSVFEPVCRELAERMSGLEALYLVRHGGLGVVPFHVGFSLFFDEPQELPHIAYLPSNDFLRWLQDGRPYGRGLVVANPSLNTPQTAPFCKREADQLTRLNAGNDFDILPGVTAVATDLARWSDYVWLHFACHGQTCLEFPMLAHLDLGGDLLTAHDVVFLLPKLKPGAVVVLSGCETGRADPRDLQEDLSLATAFLTRQASAVLCSAWAVPDLFASVVAHYFTRDLMNRYGTTGFSLEEALAFGRKLTAEEVVQICLEEMSTNFPGEAFPHEAARLRQEAASVLWQAKDFRGAREELKQAEHLLRRLGYNERADYVGHISARLPTSSVKPDYGVRVYDRPAIWGAFQLVGATHDMPDAEEY